MRSETRDRLTTVSKTMMFGCIDRAFDDLETLEDYGHIIEELGAEMPEGLMADIKAIRGQCRELYNKLDRWTDDTFDISEMLADREAEE